MKNILKFNYPFYVSAFVSILVAGVAATRTGGWIRAALLAGIVPALWWTGASMAASYYVYDRFPLYSLGWLGECGLRAPRRWLNLHAGLDEFSTALALEFPDSEGSVVDIYDAREMTEGSIARARTANAQSLAVTASGELPFGDGAFDTVFMFLAAHELRRWDARVRLFVEITRVLASGGQAVLLEHWRDSHNFAVFGPGAFHFFSGEAWRRVAIAAGFRLERHVPVTPFLNALVLRRSI